MKFLFYSLIVFNSLSSFADCKLNPQDIFEPNGKMPQGKFQGECLATESVRSFRIVEKRELISIIPYSALKAQDIQWVANVQHEGRFWIAAIPMKEAFANVVFQVEYFPPEWIAAHTQLRFNLKDGKTIKLYPQDIAFSSHVVELTSIILSIEAAPVRNGPAYDLFKGTQGHYGLASRLLSLQDKVKHIVFNERNTCDQYKLTFSGDTLDKFFALSLTRLHDPEMQKMYDTIKKSCTNSLFEVIDEFLNRKRRLNNRMFTAIPVLSKRALEHRKILEEKLQTLNEEFVEL